MGVQGRGKKSEVEELREQLVGLQAQIDELRSTQAANTKDRYSDAETGVALGVGSSRRQKVAAQRRARPRRSPSESDDDEETPEWVIKQEKLAQAAEKNGAAIVPERLVGLKRKRLLETSQSLDLSDSDLVESATHARRQRRRAGTKSKRARVESDSEEPSSDGDAAEISSAPRKKQAAGFARKGSIGSNLIKSTPSKPKAVRPPPVFKPSSGKPLPMPQWATPPGEPAKVFKLPTSSLKPHTTTQTMPANIQQKGSAKAGPSQDQDSPPYEPSYAEIESFEFKLVVSYSNDGIDYHHSTDLEGNMKSFWSCLKKQRKEWEDAAGAEWAWELQKAKGRARGRRSCVASKLAKKPTRWRKGDTGDYACRNCAKNTLLCFTWVEDEDSEHESDDEEAAIPKPKGEFWCLPVHPEDRRCGEVKKDREVRTWLNEEDNSESDSSGEDIGESSEEDDFKVGSDYGDLSKSESSSEEEDNAKESDEDDEL